MTILYFRHLWLKFMVTFFLSTTNIRVLYTCCKMQWMRNQLLRLTTDRLKYKENIIMGKKTSFFHQIIKTDLNCHITKTMCGSHHRLFPPYLQTVLNYIPAFLKENNLFKYIVFNTSMPMHVPEPGNVLSPSL